jgi:hypothetical protein
MFKELMDVWMKIQRTKRNEVGGWVSNKKKLGF